MNYQYPLIANTDHYVRASPAMRNLVSSVLDRHDPSDPIGFAHLANIAIESDKNTRIGLRSVVNPKTGLSSLDINNPPIIDDSKDPIASRFEIHPLVGEMAKTKLIEHGQKIKDPMELFSYISKVGNALQPHNYRTKWNHEYMFEDHVPQKNRIIYNQIPKKEQEMLANQFKRAISHPNFQQHIQEYGMRLSAHTAHKQSHGGNFNSPINSKFENTKNLFNIISDPDVKNSMHDFLDSYETKSPDHAMLAANIRSSMVNRGMAAPEIIRLAHKFASNPKSFDFGNYGLLQTKEIDQEKTAENGYKTHKAIFTKNNEGIKYGDWITPPVLEHEQHHKFADMLSQALHVRPFKHTRESYLDAASTLHNLFTNHPSFNNLRLEPRYRGYGKEEYVSSNHELQKKLRDMYLGFQRIIDSDNRNNPHISYRDKNWNEGQDLIINRSEMKKSRVIR